MQTVNSGNLIAPLCAAPLAGAPVPDEKIQQMLSAATWAPTHKLTEPWHFVVLGGAAKEQFEELTLQLCKERLPAEKAEATVAKLTKKKEKMWPKVGLEQVS